MDSHGGQRFLVESIRNHRDVRVGERVTLFAGTVIRLHTTDGNLVPS